MNLPSPSAAETLFLQAVGEETDRIATREPEEMRRLRTGTLENCAGSYGQYFGTWDIAHGMLRDFAFSALFPLLRIARLDPAANVPMLYDGRSSPTRTIWGTAASRPSNASDYICARSFGMPTARRPSGASAPM